MYGLKDEQKDKFAFELEKRIKNEPDHLKGLLVKAENRITEIKLRLREGANEKDFNRLGVLLHGYSSLQKVLKKAAK